MNKRSFQIVICGFILVLLAAACGGGSLSGAQQAGAETGDSSASAKRMGDKEIVMALLYQQRAAEYRALCYQCYGLAKQRVEDALRDTKHYTDKPFAVITDLDETALDNSRNEAWLYLDDSAYQPSEFNDWSQYGQAWAVPGSVDFFNWVNNKRDARGRKITIFYISNRKGSTPIIDSTMEQMRHLNFPQIIDTQFMFKGNTNSKQPRRDSVAKYHNIIVLLGDNLIDLSASFDSLSIDSAERMRRVERIRDSIGKQYIVFPNAEYGDWEEALYPGGQYPGGADALSKEQAARRKDLDSIHNSH
ncbi:MAG TPA: HAD family acid phosphatase [Puia sp.]|nr:HAD family acid phosphatase [Puia sp.]